MPQRDTYLGATAGALDSEAVMMEQALAIGFGFSLFVFCCLLFVCLFVYLFVCLFVCLFV
jgi:hypothetical protein